MKPKKDRTPFLKGVGFGGLTALTMWISFVSFYKYKKTYNTYENHESVSVRIIDYKRNNFKSDKPFNIRFFYKKKEYRTDVFRTTIDNMDDNRSAILHYNQKEDYFQDRDESKGNINLSLILGIGFAAGALALIRELVTDRYKNTELF